MRLVSAHVHGFRRLADPQNVFLERPLVCLVGANEVGKSSLLLALQLAATRDAEIETSDRSRGRGVPDDHLIAKLDFRLSKDDVAAISEVGLRGQAGRAHRFVLHKFADGRVMPKLDVTLNRDSKQRKALAKLLDRTTSLEGWLTERAWIDPSANPERLAALQAELWDDKETLSGQIISEIEDLANTLSQAEVETDLAEALYKLAADERQPHPQDEAESQLLERVPEFIPFDEDQRQLEAEYNLESVADAAPPALRNLADLSGLDLPALRQAIVQGETGTAQTMRDDANAVLKEEFQAWKQEPQIEVAFDHTDELLRVHVKSGSGSLMKIDERSDGLRQFVALVALIGGARRTIKPVLLIDEAERHLHMDAQADLMQILARQTAAEQVIYATHSPACLPENIGSSVRVLSGVEDRTESQVRNHFWTDAPGYGTLLLAMGAGSLAFVPLRPALIVEGPSDLILLGDLICEAIRRERLGYQLVPGSSNLRPTQIAGLDLQGKETVWLFDGDSAGRTRRQELLDHGIPERRVLLRLTADGVGLDLEDLVEPATYVNAVNSYGLDIGVEDAFSPEDLPKETCARHHVVASWFEALKVQPPSKIAVANKILDLRSDGETTLDPDHRSVLSSLHKASRMALGL